jgi:hypothetical protein
MIFGESWKCSICREWRPDRFISVFKRDSSEEVKLPPGTVMQNVKYCNDREECTKKARTYSFI